MIQRNRFVYIKEHFFQSTKLLSIQRNFFFDRISKKCFSDAKKLCSGCIATLLYKSEFVITNSE